MAAGTPGEAAMVAGRSAVLFTGFGRPRWWGVLLRRRRTQRGRHREPAYEIYVVNADGTVSLRLPSETIHWLARDRCCFASQCTGSLGDFDGSGSSMRRDDRGLCVGFRRRHDRVGTDRSHTYARLELTPTSPSPAATAHRSVTRSLTQMMRGRSRYLRLVQRPHGKRRRSSSSMLRALSRVRMGLRRRKAWRQAPARRTRIALGSYAITLTVRDNASGTATTSQPVTIAIWRRCRACRDVRNHDVRVDGSASRDPTAPS